MAVMTTPATTNAVMMVTPTMTDDAISSNEFETEAVALVDDTHKSNDLIDDDIDAGNSGGACRRYPQIQRLD